MSYHSADPIFEMYLYEASQMIEQTELIVLNYDGASTYDEQTINEMFRSMHTLKGSSAMMQFEGITEISHKLEDIIQLIRETPSFHYDARALSDLILESIDFFKSDLLSISNEGKSVKDTNYERIKQKLVLYWESLIQESSLDLNTESIQQGETSYSLHIMFTDDCEMKNVRAYQLVHQLSEQQLYNNIETMPIDLIGDIYASSYIEKHGVTISFTSMQSYDFILEQVEKSSYIKTISLNKEEPLEELAGQNDILNQNKDEQRVQMISAPKTSVISVNVQKLDKLMDLVGELVITEAMVANTIKQIAGDQHQHISQSNQLSKITADLQDTIMSIRMVPLSPIFHKMRRISRDMCSKLNKQATLHIIGEETEIDKSVIDQISDPLMHIIRNSIDHGIEPAEERLALGKPETGNVQLEARNIGSDVLLIISDDGRGINKDRIMQKAVDAGILTPNFDYSDREIFQCVFHPGLSTKEKIDEFSGRGVGMDVVASNIESIGGTIIIESAPNVGTTFTIKIPLTLAIIDGMNVRVGSSHFTVPTTSIKESFRPSKQQIVHNISNHNMVMVRGEIYSIVRLSEFFSISSQFTHPDEAILLMVEHEQRTICIQVDELIGQQQVVIKPLPSYLKSFNTTNRLSGCTLLGNGNISMILNINELMHHSD